MTSKKEKVYAVYWYDARGYGDFRPPVTTLARMPFTRTIGVVTEHPTDEKYIIVNIEYERNEHHQQEDIENDYPNGTVIMKTWIDKKVLIGEIEI